MGWVVKVTPRQLYLRKSVPITLLREARGTPGPVWAGTENRTPTGFHPRLVQPVTSRYTDGAIPAQLCGVLEICVNAA
jgi:hypothetical protein